MAERPISPWLWLLAAVLVLAPLGWDSGLGLSLLSQVGVAIVACLSYHVLLGQGGMLSFGHAVYTGAGAYLAIATLRWAAAGEGGVPVSLTPLVGGLAGASLALVLGYLSTRKAGLGLAMITLAIGELVWALALMLPEVFGGEAGLSGNRVVGAPVLGVTFAAQREVYALILVYTLVAALAVHTFTRTPLGRMLNAVRDNAARVPFLGYDDRWVRFLAFVFAGFLAGVAGGLAALHLEHVSADVFSASRSATLLVFVVIGGTGLFYGPVVGAVLLVASQVALAVLTPAALLYTGLAFVLVVRFAPGGVSRAALDQWQQWRRLGTRIWLRLHALGLLAASLVLAGGVAMTEMAYHRAAATSAAPLTLLGVAVDSASALAWALAVLTLALGVILLTRRRRVGEGA